MIRMTVLGPSGDLGCSVRFDRSSRGWVDTILDLQGEVLVELMHGERAIAASICLPCDLARWDPAVEVLPRPAAGSGHTIGLLSHRT